MSAQPVEPPASSSPPNAPAKRIYNVHEAKTNLSKLLERVEAGEEITIARSGK
ncbi:MAG TPA: type II toxin-antitoxin system prevent-host-death family antitoxin, partial [Phycicoccus sp.]|nr:type II toxin-antitoxin system prevent-host-death family antitoxin [Phycicoccus sp.]